MAATKFRRVTVKDLAVLGDHRQRMWIAMGRLKPDQKDPTAAAYRRWVRDRMKESELVGWAAERDGEVLATGLVLLQPTHPRPHLPRTRVPYVLSVFTEPAARGQGLARAIMDRIVAWSRAKGYGRVSLHASDEGRPIYERIGFKQSPEMWFDFPKRAPPRRSS